MMHPDLSFEQAPPISVPYRFFLTAPWFGVAAGLLLVWAGGSVVESRWMPESLALTHLMALGLMLQVMTGALLQFVPVAAGGNVWRPALVANLVHPALIAGALALVAAFLTWSELLFRAAGVLLLLAVGITVVVAGLALLRTPARGPTVWTLRAAILGLAVTVLLGAAMADALASGRSWPLVAMADVHAAWGLGGWALLLLSGVSYYVVPMFQLTPPFPARLTRWLVPAVLAVLVLWSLQITGSRPVWQQGVWLAGLAIGATFAGITLWLQKKRRRKVVDITLLFFRGAMICLLGILASALAMTLFPALAGNPRGAYWLGVLVLPGAFGSAINGMLYKIVPFLNWLHLQRGLGFGMLPPNMNDMIPAKAMTAQMRLHFAAIGVLLVAAFVPELARVGGATLAASYAFLGWNLAGAVRVYRNFKDRIRAGEPDRAR